MFPWGHLAASSVVFLYRSGAALAFVFLHVLQQSTQKQRFTVKILVRKLVLGMTSRNVGWCPVITCLSVWGSLTLFSIGASHVKSPSVTHAFLPITLFFSSTDIPVGVKCYRWSLKTLCDMKAARHEATYCWCHLHDMSITSKSTERERGFLVTRGWGMGMETDGSGGRDKTVLGPDVGDGCPTAHETPLSCTFKNGWNDKF